MQDNIILIDFNDSFTHNIASLLYQMGESCKIISHADLADFHDDGRKRVVIWGPGPGHPNDYPLALDWIKKLSLRVNIYSLGICLGHQLYWHSQGIKIRQSLNPVHGRGHQITIPKWNIFKENDWGRKLIVQRYNSLVLDMPNLGEGEKFHFADGECQMGRGVNLLTYQFHPESVGTSYPEIFFRPAIDFLYNGNNEEPTQNNRSLRS